MRLIGETIGRIRIIDDLAKGGVGEVYVGFDKKLERKVAVKALRSKYRLDKTSKARFLREARVLSQLNHINICQIHDYLEGDDLDILVLELIEGKNLDQAIADGLNEAQRFRIAEDLTSVLAVAHEQGIIHRDLKPGNIMLTPDGVAKVLDFGLARLLIDAPATTLTLGADDGDVAPNGGQEVGEQTKLGAIVGTIGYMSPEQARGEQVTTASDMYSLGLVLQHLFTGNRPYQKDLPRTEHLSRVAKAESAPVEGLDHDLTKLLERLKAPQPGARPSAQDVASRLRWIRGKRGRRVRRLVVTFAFGVLLVAVLLMAYQAVRISHEADRANREARTAEQITGFLVSLFEVSDPSENLGNTITVREVLDRGAQRALTELDSEPLVQSKLLMSIGSVYGNLGLYTEAKDVFIKALASRQEQLGTDHLDVAACHCALGNILRLLGEFGASQENYEECLRIRTRELGDTGSAVADAVEELAMVMMQGGNLEQAYSMQQRALEIRRGNPEEDDAKVADSLSGLVGLLMELAETTGDASYAEKGLTVAREALQVARTALGDQHPSVATHLNNLAFWLARGAQKEEAESLYREALAIKRKVFGKGHPSVATTMSNLSILLSTKGAFAEAEELARSALEVRESHLPAGHWRIAQAQSVLGKSLAGSGQFEEAESLLLTSHTTLSEKTGPNSILTKEAAARIASLYDNWDKPEQAALYK